MVETNKPFQHPIIESTFKQTIFQKPTSFGFTQCIDLCESSLPEKPNEKELPMAMVALVATSVRSICKLNPFCWYLPWLQCRCTHPWQTGRTALARWSVSI